MLIIPLDRLTRNIRQCNNILKIIFIGEISENKSALVDSEKKSGSTPGQQNPKRNGIADRTIAAYCGTFTMASSSGERFYAYSSTLSFIILKNTNGNNNSRTFN